MNNPIRAALEKAAEAILKNLKDRRGIRQAIEQCDADVQAEIGRTLAAVGNAAFLRALPINHSRVPFYAYWHPLARAVEDAAKEEPSSNT
jgi:hypothetical protein